MISRLLLGLVILTANHAMTEMIARQYAVYMMVCPHRTVCESTFVIGGTFRASADGTLRFRTLLRALFRLIPTDSAKSCLVCHRCLTRAYGAYLRVPGAREVGLLVGSRSPRVTARVTAHVTARSLGKSPSEEVQVATCGAALPGDVEALPAEARGSAEDPLFEFSDDPAGEPVRSLTAVLDETGFE